MLKLEKNSFIQAVIFWQKPVTTYVLEENKHKTMEEIGDKILSLNKMIKDIDRSFRRQKAEIEKVDAGFFGSIDYAAIKRQTISMHESNALTFKYQNGEFCEILKRRKV